MNLNELAKAIAKEESGKKQVTIAQIKEIIKILSMQMYFDPNIAIHLIKSGKKHYANKLPKTPKFLKDKK